MTADLGAALASSAASTLVGLMATEAWQEARAAIVGLWRRQRPQQAGRVAEDLDDAQSTVRQAREGGDHQAEAAVLAEWEGRLRALLALQPAAAADLARAVERLQPLSTTRSSADSMRANARDTAKIYQNRTTMRGTAKGKGSLYQAARDMSWSSVHNHQHEHDNSGDPTKYILTGIFFGKGPGRLLAVLGLAITIVAFTGCASILFNPNGPETDVNSPTFFGGMLPSGIPLGIVYFLGVAAGTVVAMIGSSMARAGARGRNTLVHLLISIAIIAASFIGLGKVLAGAPLSTLTPHFYFSSTDAQ